MPRNRTVPETPIEIVADLVTPHDRLAIFNGRTRNHKFVKVRRITRDPELVTIFLAEGPPERLAPLQRVKVAPRAPIR